jgi:hypothetical protein
MPTEHVFQAPAKLPPGIRLDGAHPAPPAPLSAGAVTQGATVSR